MNTTTKPKTERVFETTTIEKISRYHQWEKIKQQQTQTNANTERGRKAQTAHRKLGCEEGREESASEREGEGNRESGSKRESEREGGREKARA